MNKIYNTVEELIGKTPIVRLHKIEEKYNLKAKLFAKLEFFNPTGSAKDRAALGMILAAEKCGLISNGGTIIEPTSGNTGIALAAIAASRGYQAIIVMPSTMSRERQLLIKAYGARVELTDGAKGMAGAIERANQLHLEIENSFIPSQFDNNENKNAHFATTGPEIYETLDGKIDVFVAAVGTGGTLSGVGEYLKSKLPEVKIVAVEPAESPLLSGGAAAPHKIQGIGANFIPSVLRRDIYDEVVCVSSEEAYKEARDTASLIGIGLGISSGAALAAAIKLAEREENAGKSIVTLFPDGVDRYLSTDLFD
ncbi:MAG: cysteine synthase A [Clostridia bacterium]|nr:cysteine synthase A [Clostridia bacterium]